MAGMSDERLRQLEEIATMVTNPCAAYAVLPEAIQEIKRLRVVEIRANGNEAALAGRGLRVIPRKHWRQARRLIRLLRSAMKGCVDYGVASAAQEKALELAERWLRRERALRKKGEQDAR